MDLRKILVPTDGSERSVAAITEAVSLAKLTDASVDALYVMPHPDDFDPLDKMVWGEETRNHPRGRLREVADKRFERVVNALPEDVRGRIEPRLEAGVPYDVIVRVAEEGGYDLIVMSTHGRRGLKRFMLGSVTERVLRHASCPVLTVR